MYLENTLNLAHAAQEVTSAEQRKFNWTKNSYRTNDMTIRRISKYRLINANKRKILLKGLLEQSFEPNCQATAQATA